MARLTQSANWNLHACIIMLVLSITAVAMRFGVRQWVHRRFFGSDWMCLLALLLFIAYCSSIIAYIFVVSDHYALDADEKFGLDEVANIMKLLYALELLFGCVITAAKISVLWLYHAVFAVDQTFRKMIYATAAICLLWFVITTFILAFQCNPVYALWTEIIQDTSCMNPPKLLLGYEMTNLFLDILVLCLPIWVVRKLKLPLAKKLSTIVVFLLGSVVCIASIVRLTAIWNVESPSDEINFAPTILWSTIQLGMAIVCSCLTILRPVVSKLGTYFSVMKPRTENESTIEAAGSRPSEASDSTWSLQWKHRRNGSTQSQEYQGERYVAMHRLETILHSPNPMARPADAF